MSIAIEVPLLPTTVSDDEILLSVPQPKAAAAFQEERPPRRLQTPAMLWLMWALIFIDFIQVVGILNSLGVQSAAWPRELAQEFRFAQALGLDAWGVASTSQYEGNSSPIPSENVAASFTGFFAAMLALLSAVFLVRAGCMVYQDRKHPESVLVRQSVIVGTSYLLTYILLIPVGIAVGRSYHCVHGINGDPDNVMDTDNSVMCGSSLQVVFMAIGTLLYLPIAAALVYKLLKQVRRSAITDTQRRHESFLRSQEDQFNNNVSDSWLIKRLYLITPLRRRGIYHWIYMCAGKVVLIIIFAVGRDSPSSQAVVFLITLTVLGLQTLLSRPFRVLLLNIVWFLALLCLMGLSLLLVLKRTRTQQALLESPYINDEAWTCVGVGLGSILLGIIFHLLRRSRNLAVWPVAVVSPRRTSHQRIQHVLKQGHSVLERCWHGSRFLAPVHELGRQIQIVNAYLRDASSTTAKKRKYQEIQDEQDLAHLLDDLIAAHSQLKPDSIYTLSVKPSVWETAEALEEALLEAIPRLVERDREMIMIPKVLRRARLKAFCAAVFIKRLERVSVTRRVQTAKGISRDAPYRTSYSENIDLPAPAK